VAGTVRALTLNIWNREGPWERRRELLRTWLERLQPDLIGLQEAKDLEQVGELFGSSYHSTWMGNEISGIAIVSRWPIRERTELVLIGDGSDPGGAALRVLVDSPHAAISFCCATTFFYKLNHGYKRERQMPQLARFARGNVKDGDYPAILVGDLNAHDESAEIRYLKGLQSLEGSSAYFVDAWEVAGDGGPGTTWSRQNDFASGWLTPNRRLDYIFVGRPRMPDGAGLVERCEVVCNERKEDIWPSDHFGVYAVLNA
jgi:endonuclease/exonuclease/phosphatase family metal-dependent hydrolase